ncbi:hypothetical protein ASZ90_019086 [hydrocarbon metagenome]|uniref:HTH marR-type domain-containing protein n=1 Tax=hydrocarbon metagenome TaxID=938273 RepID=A0A0W8E4G2_9ZZZZ
MSELASCMQISKQQLTPLIGKLIDRGLAARKTDEDDRRFIHIEITDAGRSMIETLMAEMKSTFAARLNELSNTELTELGQMLSRIMKILQGN